MSFSGNAACPDGGDPKDSMMLLMLFSWGNFTEVKEVGVAAEEEKLLPVSTERTTCGALDLV